jgi:serine phosphatase RsbU (regulator of sigma subunit)
VHPTLWPFPVYPADVVKLLMPLSVLVILLRRFIRARRDEAQMATEMESARAVQKVLIPSAMPEIPGFQLDSVYIPALQVGGDFFQVMHSRSGGVLAAIGDVSGKGMPAAMTVSLLVGTLRTLAHYTESPGEILAAMNARMLRRSEGGFTTCLVLRADPDGVLTLANAGHLAPYVNGTELQLENGLPLGLAAESTYLETAAALGPTDQLTLMTDGVVEARSRSGEMYGFSRTAGIATQGADEIATAAQAFGQEDDITVLTIRRAGLRSGPSLDETAAIVADSGS